MPAANLSIPDLLSPVSVTSETNPQLSKLIIRLQDRASSKYVIDYANDRRESDALRCREKVYQLRPNTVDIEKALADYLKRCKAQVEVIYENILHALNAPFGGGKYSEQMPALSAMAVMVKHWPRICPMILLQQLTHCRWQKLNDIWKQNIIAYGLALSNLQYAERLLVSCQIQVRLRF